MAEVVGSVTMARVDSSSDFDADCWRCGKWPLNAAQLMPAIGIQLKAIRVEIDEHLMPLKVFLDRRLDMMHLLT
ncbi:MAG: hypothetical protein ABG776_13675 [Cyanobacteria bacterium J06555_13]